MTVVLADEACAVALVALPAMGPARLRAIHDEFGFGGAWRRIVAGDPGRHLAATLSSAGAARADEVRALPARWHRAAAGIDPRARLSAHEAAGVAVRLSGTAAYPEALAGDVEPPAVLFTQGDLEALGGPRVAVVGTRRCTRTGSGVAYELGRDLAAAGVVVVSGLALGIDGAAHRGALAADAAPPVAVVGTGLDVVYPARNADLWQQVAARGLVLSEAPLGSPPDGWRFPARNRIIAALADVVVVVESREHGGSLHTVDEADRRDVDVFAVPGSVRAPASAGTNALLAEGRAPARDAVDVLVALGLDASSRRRAKRSRAEPDGHAGAVLDAFEWQPATLDLLAMRTALPLPTLGLELARLEQAGWVTATGGWYERVVEPRGR